MARQVGALAAALWAAWLLLSALRAPTYVTHVIGFAASLITAYMITRRATTEGQAPPGVALMLAGAALVTAGIAAEYVLVILPNKASLDVALPPPLSTIGYVLIWSGIAAFAVSAAVTVLDVAYTSTRVYAKVEEDEKKKLYFGEGRVKYRTEKHGHGKTRKKNP